ncbi:MAG: zinc metallopeptidase, partial [Lachnospiraceae bacterium]|nr:zinc metallopeptidase [Lachnospiraceae bacterium]
MFGYYFDPTYILVLIGALLCILASSRVNSTYSKYAKIRSKRGITGAEAAQRILQMSGIHDVQIQHVAGNLTDHYDPSQKVLRLSDTVYGSNSVAAIGVAAHECGHALQHKEGYLPLKIRSALVPAANIGSRLGIPIVILGLVLGIGFELPGGGYFSLAEIGIWVFALAVLFQVITLPVEFNASGRALKMLGSYG